MQTATRFKHISLHKFFATASKNPINHKYKTTADTIRITCTIQSLELLNELHVEENTFVFCKTNFI